MPSAMVQRHHGEPGDGSPTVAADLRHQVFVPLHRARRHVFSRLRGSRVHRNIPAVLLHGGFGSFPGIYFVRALADEAAAESSVLLCLLIFRKNNKPVRVSCMLFYFNVVDNMF